IDSLHRSTSWRLTKPLRQIKQKYLVPIKIKLFNPDFYRNFYEAAKNKGLKNAISKSYKHIRENGLLHFIRFLMHYSKGQVTYKEWVKLHDTLNDEARQAIKKHIASFKLNPKISIIMPVYNIDKKYLVKALDSVCNQLYENFELCIADDCSTMPHIKEIIAQYQKKDARIKVVYRKENGHISAASNSSIEIATGEYLALLDHDDELSEHALYYVVNEINNHPQADLIYSDEDNINENNDRFHPYFKSDWDPDLFFGQNMFNHFGVYRTTIVKEIGGFRVGYEGAQDYDLCLRVLAKSSYDKVRHIPQILYHWRAIEGSTAMDIDYKQYALDASRKAMQDYFNNNYQNVTVSDPGGIASKYGYHRINWPLPDALPLVSIIIPTKNKLGYLQSCVESIIEKTEYYNYEIIIIDNQSDDANVKQYYAEITQQHKNIKAVDYDKKFNFSAINNYAVKEYAQGEILLFLNNDTEVITHDWLTEMVRQSLRSDVGAVGAKLLYENDYIQHAGVILNAGSGHATATHSFCNICYKDHPHHYSYPLLTRSVSAVTAACLALSREKFDEVGGFDEENLRVAYNDIDLCIKLLEQGYRNIFTPFAMLYHYESISRGADDSSNPKRFAEYKKEVEYMQSKWKKILNSNDPYYNPNLDQLTADYSISSIPRVQKPWKKYLK
ncbi:MAG: glycosyltransferase family 2 protein, partial [Pseudomonadota bacterium]